MTVVLSGAWPAILRGHRSDGLQNGRGRAVSESSCGGVLELPRGDDRLVVSSYPASKHAAVQRFRCHTRAALGEVIDVARIRVVTEAPDLVLLDLATASTAPPVFVGEPRPEPTREEVVAALRAVLDATPPGRTVAPLASGPTFIGNPIHWFRIVFGWG